MKPNDIEKSIKEDGSCRILLNEYEEIRADAIRKFAEWLDNHAFLNGTDEIGWFSLTAKEVLEMYEKEQLKGE